MTRYSTHTVPCPVAGFVGVVVIVGTWGVAVHSCGWTLRQGEAERRARDWIAARHVRRAEAEGHYRRGRDA